MEELNKLYHKYLEVLGNINNYEFRFRIDELKGFGVNCNNISNGVDEMTFAPNGKQTIDKYIDSLVMNTINLVSSQNNSLLPLLFEQIDEIILHQISKIEEQTYLEQRPNETIPIFKGHYLKVFDFNSEEVHENFIEVLFSEFKTKQQEYNQRFTERYQSLKDSILGVEVKKEILGIAGFNNPTRTYIIDELFTDLNWYKNLSGNDKNKVVGNILECSPQSVKKYRSMYPGYYPDKYNKELADNFINKYKNK